MSFTTNAAERMRITSTGNVGIGTTAPAEKLEVTGNLMLYAADADIKLKSGGAGTTGAVRWTFSTNSTSYGDISLPYDTRASVGLLLHSIGSYPITIDSGNSVIFKEDGSETMRIAATGNVGIGTTTPGRLLEVSAAGAAYVRVRSTATSGDTFIESLCSDNTRSNYLYFGDLDNIDVGNIRYNHQSNFLSITVNASERIRITSAGYVGIGTSSPARHLSVNGSIQFASGGVIEAGTSSLNTYIAAVEGASGRWAFATNGSERIRITSAGNVGIGTTAPAKQLSITKSALATINTLTDGATITPNFDAGQNFSVTLAGNRTLANPTNIDAGQTGSIFITQDGTGSRTLSFGSYWDFAGGTAPTLSTAAGAVDRIDYIVRTGTSIHAVATLNLS
jgi:hypothetical protein